MGCSANWWMPTGSLRSQPPPGRASRWRVAHASRRFNRPVAWLSVDATDAAPGRLVTYLEEALAQQLPSVRGIATGALAAGIPHAEAAGLLVDAAADAEVVFVLDDLERLHGSPPAWEVIGSVVRYGPPSMRLILISRRATGCLGVVPRTGRGAGTTRRRGSGVHRGGGAHRPAGIGPPGGRGARRPWRPRVAG